MLDKLRQAAQAGEKFRDNLAQTSMFNTTKWLDGASSAVKPAVFAMAVASGASTGAAVAEEAQITPSMSTYETLIQEAQALDAMPHHEAIETLRQRPANNTFSEYEQVSVRDLATRIAAYEDDTMHLRDYDAQQYHPLADSPVRLQNVYAPNQPVQATVSTNLEGAKNVIGLNTDDPEKVDQWAEKFIRWDLSNSAYVASPKEGGDESFFNAPRSASVVMPPKMGHEGTWIPDASNRVEEVSFVLYHEMAHTHATQIMMTTDERIDADTFLEAKNAPSTKMALESHSHVSAALSVNKEFDLSPIEFQERLAHLRNSENGYVVSAGMEFTKNQQEIYRAGKALDVLGEIAERDPQFLKNLSYEEIPYVAHEIVKTAGYYHNAADVIIDTDLKQVAPSLNQALHGTDISLTRQVSAIAPDNEVFQNARDDLDTIWAQKNQRGEYEALKAALDTRPTLDGNANPEQTIKSLTNVSTNLTVNELIQSHLPEVNGNRANLEANLDANLAALSNDVDQRLAQMPDNEELNIKRADALASVEGELRNLSSNMKAFSTDPELAEGTGQTTQQIAANIIDSYSGSFNQADQYIADYEAADHGDSVHMGM